MPDLSDERLEAIERDGAAALKPGDLASLVAELWRRRDSDGFNVEVALGAGSAAPWESWRARPTPSGLAFRLTQGSGLPARAELFPSGESDPDRALKALEKWRENDVRGQQFVQFVRARRK